MKTIWWGILICLFLVFLTSDITWACETVPVPLEPAPTVGMGF